MGRKFITNEAYINRLRDRGVLEKVTPLEEYKGKNTKILFKCNVCGYEWKARTDHIAEGNVCPRCRDKVNHDKYAKTHEQFILELEQKGILEKVQILERYYANDVPILVKCKKCGYEWKTPPHRLLSGRLCKKCAIENKKKNNIQFILELKEKGVLDKIIPLEEYKGCKEKITFKCLKCGKEWKGTPSNILQNKGCPYCLQSTLERNIEKLLKRKKIEYIPQYIPKFLISGKSHLSLDFYLPGYNIAIECQGEQHFYPVDYWGSDKQFSKQKERDELKFNLCAENGITIYYYATCKIPNDTLHEYYSLTQIECILDTKIVI